LRHPQCTINHYPQEKVIAARDEQGEIVNYIRSRLAMKLLILPMETTRVCTKRYGMTKKSISLFENI
jgi:hypothetical protein